MKNKKKVICAVVIAVLLALLLIPIPVTMNDGGSVTYAAVLYQVTDYHRLSTENGVEGFTEGFRVDILGFFTLFEKTWFVPQE